jgi:hypothetical protein
MMTRWLAVTALLASAPAHAEQRGFGVGIEAGVVGIGANLRVGRPDLGAYIGLSLTPIIVQDPSQQYIDVFLSKEVRVDGFAFMVKTERAHFGVIGGASYNSLLGFGGNLGAGANLRLSPNIDATFNWTIGIFPDAGSRLRSHVPAQDNPSVPWLQGGGFALGLAFYL